MNTRNNRYRLSEQKVFQLNEYRKLQGKELTYPKTKRYRLSEDEIEHLGLKKRPDNKRESKSFSANVNQELSKPFDIAAFDNKGSILSFEDWQNTHGLLFPEGTTYNLITHTGKPYYNVRLPKGATDVITRTQMEDIIVDSFKKTNITPEYINTTPEIEQALHVYFSDLHIAAKTESESIYKNDYNFDVLLHRVNQIFIKISQKRKIHGRFESLLFADLGDALDGFDGYTTRGGHKLPQNMSNKEAFNAFVSLYKMVVDFLVRNDIASNYKFHFVANSNHGGDFDWMAMRSFQEYCSLKYPQVEVVIQEKFVGKHEYGCHTFLFLSRKRYQTHETRNAKNTK